MTSSLYLDRRTPLHRVHPTSKLLATGALFVAVFSLETPGTLWPYPALLLLALGLARGQRNLVRLRWLFLVLPLGAMVLWTFFFAGGTPLARFGPLRVTPEGAIFGAGMALKLVTFLLLNVILLSTTRVEELTFAFTRLGLPYRVGFAFTLAFRLVPVFVESAGAVLQAQRLRSAGAPVRPWRARMARTAQVIVPVFMSALRRADRMAIALELRGFSRAGPRSGALHLEFGMRDVLVLSVGVLALASAIFVRRAGLGVFGG